ncbi:MAG TPA: ABC transporter ATP-binding protein [Syntrophomonadaceae bacterium]|nr:ABC transporter ATP-binding protein [Syntrophomonadaceae bacterium]
MADQLIKITDLVKDYGEGAIRTRVLQGINMELHCGEFTSLIGASGSGKSTLLNIIGALDRPTGGTVMIDGTDLSRLDDDELALFRNRTIGFIFQFHFLLPQFTVLENVLIPAMIYDGFATPAMEKRALELLERVGLSHRRDSRANAISGGEQQRAAVARALINQPRIILADEPTGNLDSANTELVFSLLREMNGQYCTSMIMVTHDRKLADRSDRLVEISDGRVLSDTYLEKSGG